MIRGVLVAALVIGLAGCGDDLEDPAVVIESATVRVTVTPVPARIEIVRLSDGEVIFDGASDIAAFRDHSPEIETQTGAFRIEEDRDTPWRVVETFKHVTRTSDTEIDFDLGRPDGRPMGTGRVIVGDADVEIVLDTDPRLYDDGWIAFASPPEEHLIGLGGQSFDVDHRGQTVPLWVEEDGITKRDDDEYEGVWFLSGRRHATHTPMPIVISTRGYAAVLETDARAVFALASEGEDVNRLEAWDSTIDLHVVVADDVRTVLAPLAEVIGKPAPPPDAIFAPWLDALYGSDNVRRVAQALRAEDIPFSAMWTEDFRGGNDEGTGYTLEEDWGIDADLYPDFGAVASELADDGIRWLTYYNTFLDESADVFDEALDAGYSIHDGDGAPYLFTGVKFRDASMVDLTNPDAMAWVIEQLEDNLQAGSGGWMADFGEWLPTDAALASGEDALRVHNRYPVLWAAANYHVIGPDPIYFMRSAWLGSQRWSQVMWAGDQQTDWSVGDGLPSVIPIGLGLGMTGFPYYGHDIGGYMSQLTEPTTKELWFRWCTLGALTPVMRTHHGRSARANWNWESDAETTAHLKRWAKLHMSLVPYLRARSAEFQATGRPIMRPVGLEYPDDDWAWVTTDEYMLGDRILVAPVIVEGATSRDVQLPAGTWYPLLGGAPIEGGGTITVDAAVTEIPAFVPEGSVLTLYPDGVDTLVDAPGVDATVTANDVGSDRVIVLFPGTPSDGEAHHARDTSGVVDVAWTGCADDPAMPTAATRDGGTALITIVDGDPSVDLTLTEGTHEITFDTCGTATITVRGELSDYTYQVRLRVPS